MSRLLSRLAVVALAVAVVFLMFETARLAELAGSFEREAHQQRARAEGLERTARERAAANQAQPAAAEKPSEPAAVDLAEYSRIQLELHTTKEQLAAVTKLLEQRNREIKERAEESQRRARELLQPMPGGVRLCLEALHDGLRTEGFEQQRFLRASSLDDEGLHDVELLDAASDGFGVAFVVAGRMTATVHRATGSLELRFFDGHRAAEGERAELPEDGLPLVFEDIDGRMFEKRLPFLVRGEGSYPVEVTADGRSSTDLDPGSRRQWLARLERVLAMASTQLHWRPTRLRGLHDAQFLTVDLVGTNDKHHVIESAHCERVAVEVDEERSVVSLLLMDGVLRRGGIESTIRKEGYRMLLPGLTPKQATDAMFGMVLKK